MEEYASNSHKSKELPEARKERRAEKVVTGEARIKKKSEIAKFMGELVSDDAENVKDYVLMDVFVPSIKRAISEIASSIFNTLNDGVDLFLYGKLGSPNKTKTTSSISRSAYGKVYDQRNSSIRREQTRRPGLDYNDIILDSRGEAEKILMTMEDIIATYGMVSVYEFYDLAGIDPPGGYANNYYGWTDVSKATISRQRDGGYLLSMPKALPFD